MRADESTSGSGPSLDEKLLGELLIIFMLARYTADDAVTGIVDGCRAGAVH